MSAYIVELLGIMFALGLLIFLAFRGYTLLLAAPVAAIVAAAFSGEPLLAKWTITFMQATGRFIANFFPLFLLGGVFGKLMDDSGCSGLDKCPTWTITDAHQLHPSRFDTKKNKTLSANSSVLQR